MRDIVLSAELIRLLAQELHEIMANEFQVQEECETEGGERCE